MLAAEDMESQMQEMSPISCDLPVVQALVPLWRQDTANLSPPKDFWTPCGSLATIMKAVVSPAACKNKADYALAVWAYKHLVSGALQQCNMPCSEQTSQILQHC